MPRPPTWAGVDHFAITPDDTDEIDCRAIYVGGGGNIKMKLADSDAFVTYNNVVAGQIYPLAARVVHTDTTATNLVGIK